MRVALAVNTITPDPEKNLREILGMIDTAAHRGVDLILFPEAAVTGLINNDDPAHDFPLGQPIPGPVTARLALRSRDTGMWIALGLLERDGDALYDSAVLLAPDGDVKLKYRRVQPQWHGRRADPRVYRQGTEVVKVDTPFGALAFLICGDLFDDVIVARLKELRPDWLLFPFARCFRDGSYDQARWECEEQADYTARVRLVGVPTLMVNGLAPPKLFGGSFGGAWFVAADGTIQASWPLGKPGLLVVDAILNG